MRIKVMTYNVHSCKSLSKKNSMAEIKALFKKYKPSIIGLNEVERHSPRTLFVNQPKKLAQARQMQYVFGPAIKIGPIGFFGNALLSRFPILEWENIKLHSKLEFRSCIKARLRLQNGYLSVLVTHLGLNKEERAAQIKIIVKLIEKCNDPVLLMGDFNAFTEELASLKGLLRDVGLGSEATFPSNNPKARIDYIFVSQSIKDFGVQVINSDATDHLPVLSHIEIK